MTTWQRVLLSFLVLVVLSVSACNGGTSVVRSNTGVVQGFVRVFDGGPIEPTPLPLSPFSARVEVKANNRVVAAKQAPPGHEFHFSLPMGQYVLSADINDKGYERRVGPLFCNASRATIRSGHTTSIDLKCYGTAA
jgi:hypothetical protein